mmetsp:Transcript_17393/g.41575  ORF Transcript_17393/g.41575 Transcript_17393/m.41575 type:complete len:351 (+) Transcript_17393:681-1733(+)
MHELADVLNNHIASPVRHLAEGPPPVDGRLARGHSAGDVLPQPSEALRRRLHIGAWSERVGAALGAASSRTVAGARSPMGARVAGGGPSRRWLNRRACPPCDDEGQLGHVLPLAALGLEDIGLAEPTAVHRVVRRAARAAAAAHRRRVQPRVALVVAHFDSQVEAPLHVEHESRSLLAGPSAGAAPAHELGPLLVARLGGNREAAVPRAVVQVLELALLLLGRSPGSRRRGGASLGRPPLAHREVQPGVGGAQDVEGGVALGVGIALDAGAVGLLAEHASQLAPSGGYLVRVCDRHRLGRVDAQLRDPAGARQVAPPAAVRELHGPAFDGAQHARRRPLQSRQPADVAEP